MRKNFGVKQYLYPQPVLIVATYSKDGKPNAMNVGWGMLSAMDAVSICIDKKHKTSENIIAQKAFTVSIATAEYVQACDYVGLVSANKDPDKFTKAGFTAIKSEFVNAPLIAELPLAFDCELLRIDENDDDTHIIVGKILNVNADESILDEEGKVDVVKLNPLAVNPIKNTYIKIGEDVARAFGAGKNLIKK